MVALPRWVKVGPFTFSVFGDAKNFKRVTRPHDGELEEILRDCFIKGLTDNNTCEIVLNPVIGAPNKPETMMHEVLHAAWYASQLNTNSDICDMEEEIVTRLSPMLLMVLRDNPQLVSYFLQKPNTSARRVRKSPSVSTRRKS